MTGPMNVYGTKCMSAIPAVPRFPRRSMAALLFVALPLWVGGAWPYAVTAAETDIESAMMRGFGWLERHPASVSDGGLPDLLDEGIGYYLRANQSAAGSERARYETQLRKHMTRLGNLPDFQVWVYQGRKKLTDYYYLVLAAHLMRMAGEPSELQGEIAAQSRQVLRVVQHCDPTKRLAIALFLHHQGEDTGIPVQAVFAVSRIERIGKGGPPPLPPPTAPVQERTSASLELYALVHEIVAITDFGRLPPSPWLKERRDALSRFLGQAVTWAATSGNVDLAAELLMSARLLQEPLSGPYRDAVLAITAGQLEDGSWGDATPQRVNMQRHAVLTATTALWVYLRAPAAQQADDEELD